MTASDKAYLSYVVNQLKIAKASSMINQQYIIAKLQQTIIKIVNK